MPINPWDIENVVLQELLTNCRAEAQLTQKQLASLLKKPQSYVSKYESGERKLTLPEIRKIVNACGATLKDFTINYENELLLNEQK